MKEPLGFKSDFTEVSVRASTKSNSSQVELLENVILSILTFLESLGIRKIALKSAAHVALYLLDDWLKLVHLHDHVHGVLVYGAFHCLSEC